MPDIETLRIEFSLRRLNGVVEASLIRNTDPNGLGYPLLVHGQPADFARDYPVCRATVEYPADGYAAIFGWTQMVRSTDSSRAFEMDPISIYRTISTPFCWYGYKPTLFDAPSRPTRYDIEWEAHSFLCVSPDSVMTRHVQAVAGFSWGFAVEGGKITLVRPLLLGPEAWDTHAELLNENYPDWVFDSGYPHSSSL